MITFPQLIKKLSKFNILILLLSLAAITRIIINNPIAADTWTHMSTGRFFIDQKRIPNHEDISYKTRPDVLQWIPSSWLSDTFIYLSASENQILAVFLILLPLLLLSIYILSKILERLEITEENKVISIVISLSLASIFWKLHPLVFITPLALLLILIYLKWRDGQSNASYLIVPLLLLWANMYGGLVAIPILFILLQILIEVVILTVNKLFKFGIAGGRGNLIVYIFSFLVGSGVTFFNPSGGVIWVYAPTMLSQLIGQGKFYSTLAGTFVAANSSYVKESIDSVHFSLFLAISIVSILSFIYYSIRQAKSFLLKNLYLISLLPLFALGYIWIRFIPIVGFMTMPLFAVIYQSFKIPKIATYVFAIFLISTMLIKIPTTFRIMDPKDQIEFIQKNNLPKNVLTTPDLTGYALYHLYPQRLGIDILDDFFDEHEAINVYSLVSSAPKEFIDQLSQNYGVNTIVASKDADYLIIELNRNPDWALVYFDYNGFIFVRRDSVPKDFLDQKEITSIDISKNLGFDINNISKSQTELERFVGENPKSALAIGQLATVYRLQKKYTLAEKTLEKIPEEKRDFIYMTEMGRINAAQGLCKSSEDWYLKALEYRNERNLSRAVLDLAVVYAGCFGDKDKAEHYFKRYNSYPLSIEEREKAKKIANDFGIILD